MKVLVILTFFISLNSYSNSSLENICPVELRELILEGGGACEETFPVARPFLDDASNKRLEDSQSFLGDLLISSLKTDIESLADIDQIYFNLGLDYEGSDSCSLEKMKENFPCSLEDNDNLALLTRNLPGGEINNVNALFDMIGAHYKEQTVKGDSTQGNSCLNQAWTRGVFLQEILNQEIDFIEFHKFLAGEKTSEEAREKLTSVEEKLINHFPEFIKHLKEMPADSSLKGSFKDQLSSFLSSTEAKESFKEKSIERCNAMSSKIADLVCKPLDNQKIGNRDFSLGALNYNPDDFEFGFDEFALELSGAGDPEQAYANYILNCSPECEDCDGKLSVDAAIDTHFGGDVNGVIRSSVDGEVAASRQKMNDNFCPLLACENAMEVFKGAACTEREVWRTPEEMRSVLNCPEDEMCNEESFKSFTQVLTARTNPPVSASSPEATVQSSPRMSSFSRQFLGEPEEANDVPEPTSGAQVVEAAPTDEEVRSLPATNFSEAQDRIDRAAERRDGSRSGPATRGGRRGASFRPQNNFAQSSTAAIRRGNRINRDKFYRNSDGQVADDSDDYGDVLKSLIDVVKGQNEVGRLRDELLDSSLQDIAQNNKKVLSNMNNQGFNDQARGRRRSATDRRTLDRLGQDFENGVGELDPLDVAMPESSSEEPIEGISDQSVPSGSGVAGARNAGRGGRASGGGGGAAPSGGGVGSEIPTPEVDSEDTGLPQYEINQQTLRGMDVASLRSNLKRKGIKPDRPFVMLVRSRQGEVVKLPVKPLSYLGQTVFVPIIMQANAEIVELVEQSPLFRGYRDYLGSP